MRVLVDGEKVCPSCKLTKPFSEFHKDRISVTGRAHYCKECANSKSRAHHREKSKNEEWAESRRQKMSEKTKQSKLRAIEYLGGSCLDCGGVFPFYVFDFHHLDGNTKSDNPSRSLRRSWEKAKVELDKCVLLCSNCHRGRHFGD